MKGKGSRVKLSYWRDWGSPSLKLRSGNPEEEEYGYNRAQSTVFSVQTCHTGRRAVCILIVEILGQ